MADDADTAPSCAVVGRNGPSNSCVPELLERRERLCGRMNGRSPQCRGPSGRGGCRARAPRAECSARRQARRGRAQPPAPARRHGDGVDGEARVRGRDRECGSRRTMAVGARATVVQGRGRRQQWQRAEAVTERRRRTSTRRGRLHEEGGQARAAPRRAAARRWPSHAPPPPPEEAARAAARGRRRASGRLAPRGRARRLVRRHRSRVNRRPSRQPPRRERGRTSVRLFLQSGVFLRRRQFRESESLTPSHDALDHLDPELLNRILVHHNTHTQTHTHTTAGRRRPSSASPRTFPRLCRCARAHQVLAKAGLRRTAAAGKAIAARPPPRLVPPPGATLLRRLLGLLEVGLLAEASSSVRKVLRPSPSSPPPRGSRRAWGRRVWAPRVGERDQKCHARTRRPRSRSCGRQRGVDHRGQQRRRSRARVRDGPTSGAIAARRGVATAGALGGARAEQSQMALSPPARHVL